MNERREIQTAEKMMVEDTFMAKFREHYHKEKRERPFSAYEPAYRLGYELAQQTENHPKSWAEVEETAQQQWQEQYHVTGANLWQEVKEAVYEGWNTWQTYAYRQQSGPKAPKNA